MGRGEQLCQGDTDLVIPVPHIKPVSALGKGHTMSREAKSRFCRLSVNEVTSCPCWELEWSRRSCAGLGKHSFASPAPEHLRNLQNWLGCQKWVSLDLYSLCRDKFYGSANRKRFKTTALDQKCFSRSCFFLPLSGSRCWNIQQNSFSLFFFDTLSFTRSICSKEIPVLSPLWKAPNRNIKY